MSDIILKITPRTLWEKAEQDGVFFGAPIDLEDGFIHFSTVDQVRETADKHFSKQDDLLIIAVDASKLGDQLKYEVSRGGALFPHFYSSLSLDHVLWAKPLPIGEDGHHIFPEV